MTRSDDAPVLTRRQLLGHAAVAAAGGALALRAAPSQATPAAMAEAIAALTGGAPAPSARVTLRIAELVENGNAVPVTVTVDSPMTEADHVRRIAIFTEQNPQPEVAVFALSPANGRAEVGTRMRLATTQTVVALAQTSDGRWWQHRVDVVVTLAACIEGG